jgi:hypothetical protein
MVACSLADLAMVAGSLGAAVSLLYLLESAERCLVSVFQVFLKFLETDVMSHAQTHSSSIAPLLGATSLEAIACLNLCTGNFCTGELVAGQTLHTLKENTILCNSV